MPALTPTGFPRDSELGKLLAEISEMIDAQRFADAIPLMTRAVEQMPTNGPLHANLGGLFLETGQYPKAVKYLRKAAALSPGIALIHWRLGTALQMAGDAKGAIDAFERAVELRPDLADAHLGLALLYRQQGQRLDSREQYRIAALLSGDPAKQQFLEAQALLDERQEEEAEALLRSALELQPDLPGANGVLGQVLYGLGRFDEAEQHFKAEIAVSPNGSRAYYDLARCRKVAEGDETLLQQIDAVLAQPILEDANRAMMLLARGKLLDDLGRYEAAMKSLDEAAVLRTRAFGIEVEAFESRVDRIISFFSAETFARHSLANDDRTPVFIVGMPRSGTTLVEQIISSHPKVAAGGELSFWTELQEAVLSESVDRLNDTFFEIVRGRIYQSPTCGLPYRNKGNGQKAFQLSCSWIDPPGVSPRFNHPLPATSGRHSPVNSPDAFHQSDRNAHGGRRFSQVFPRPRTADGALAAHAATGTYI